MRSLSIFSIRAFTAVLIASMAGLTAAQGLLVDIDSRHRVPLPRPIIQPRPTPPASYKVESIDVHVNLKDQVAQVGISQTFQNTGSRQMEVCFVFPLPYDSAVDELTLMVDGKEFEGKVLSADEARKLYEDIVRKNQDPALLEWLGSGMVKTSVFPVPAGAKRTVSLHYTQLCRQSDGLTDLLLPLRTARYTSGTLDSLSITVAIESSQPIKNIYSASHAVEIKRNGERRAVVKYESKNEIPSADFRLFYDATAEGLAASVVSYRPDADDAGYFLLLASPDIKAQEENPPAKTVVFVVDRSGSMSGEKMDQAKGAIEFVLNNLREGDTFNIVAYDGDVEAFRPELERFNNTTREQALGFVAGLYAGGSTNIAGALERAFGMLNDSSRPSYVVFLSDGIPTAGETNEAKIVQAAGNTNSVRARLFSFGVGYDVNSRLLDRLVRSNFGQSEYVRPDQDIEASVSRLYRRIGTPVLTDVQLSLDVEGAQIADGPIASRTYPAGAFDLFAGDQAVIVGRYAQSGDAKVKLSGAVSGKEQSFDFPAKLVQHSSDDTNSFIAKLWAARRVGEIIDEIDLNGKNDELLEELVNLATKHGILTQYTSFLADETLAAPTHLADNVRRSATATREALAETEGRYAFRQRAAKSNFKAAPQADGLSLSGLGGRGNAVDEALEMPAEDLVRVQQGLAYGNTLWFDAANSRCEVATNIMQCGRKTFFRQNNRWVDSSITDEEQQHTNKVDRFSREYFDLMARYGSHVNQYLAIDDPVVVRLDGKVYEW
ncbi:VWA domain-containing protein [Aeoliella sp. ICT_H6.2]|uniref:VWA domain-containing protein n=1 Tax=Aeoliella straminimaris TaxID=2954799 RepID=A0A9X2FI61_9BACT|nr:VIT domain-containing protein [Aeoliella straminimaris]MCO6045631.1 VWA domain-containing protein [Aeoliella straminimaris]